MPKMTTSVAFLLSGHRLPCIFLVFMVFGLCSGFRVPSKAADIPAKNGPARTVKDIRKVSVDAGKNLLLDCDSASRSMAADSQMMWVRYDILHKNPVPLFRDTIQLLRKNQRYHLAGAFDLRILNVTAEDIAVFECFDLVHPEITTRYEVFVRNLPPGGKIQQVVPGDSGVLVKVPELKGHTMDQSGTMPNGAKPVEPTGGGSGKGHAGQKNGEADTTTPETTASGGSKSRAGQSGCKDPMADGAIAVLNGTTVGTCGAGRLLFTVTTVVMVAVCSFLIT